MSNRSLKLVSEPVHDGFALDSRTLPGRLAVDGGAPEGLGSAGHFPDFVTVIGACDLEIGIACRQR